MLGDGVCAHVLPPSVRQHSPSDLVGRLSFTFPAGVSPGAAARGVETALRRAPALEILGPVRARERDGRTEVAVVVVYHHAAWRPA